MSGDQWFTLLKLALFLAFALTILYGIYKIMTNKDV